MESCCSTPLEVRKVLNMVAINSPPRSERTHSNE